MTVMEKLEALSEKAEKDPALKDALLMTETAESPLTAFCRLARAEGLELWEMDVIEAGEYLYAAMKRSTNGGGENSPVLRGEDDLYELFLASLRSGARRP